MRSIASFGLLWLSSLNNAKTLSMERDKPPQATFPLILPLNSLEAIFKRIAVDNGDFFLSLDFAIN